MNRKTLRMVAVAAMAAIAIGAGSGLAQASEARQPASATQPVGVLGASDTRVLPADTALVAELSATDAQSLRAVEAGPGNNTHAPAAEQAWPLAVAALAARYGPTLIRGAIAASKNGVGALRAYLKTTKLARDPSEMQAVINTIMQFFGTPPMAAPGNRI
ncbi:hypothetical protein [Streptomyces sp. Isolate_45]|uniref:hypothetical protein n=1 Tax=Streptomyces sp. Isolate_45 TaxID=2950111 RepID=UPI002481A2A6|nr:hypothetical protein [Streptomyces sp. Isolate_45]MDA5286329.1 hypothetical protein [Streptomyces sp. Isolate_45]